MAYSGLYQHFPPYTGPASPGPHSSPATANNNNTSSCSPAKSEPGASEGGPSGQSQSHSPGGYKWSAANNAPGAQSADSGRGGGSVTDILSPFQSYDQHHQVIIIIIITCHYHYYHQAQAAAAHNLNYYMYLQSQSMGHPGPGPHHPITPHYNNSIPNNI